ncbi:mismatch repair protein PMS1 putativemismatch repair protein [Leptomonas pyrrhocoris]|uniref:Mismatch repair protein PMS1 putativemismatch repair protein n=1 Tax=Leptomonas pyrrhocoris TaxID=157538 RepID=A0A0M9GAA4_LEPPY|nr:mismatch repair protein PMS1 putativemismatch repair protein [Leptomonas pyrrhocoris]KPA86083.1 mismatch repair protein PMS1 putativemismatch repair protein [Leptomonas pyrrhocoris]|eukprot:XP_015664522.1 mismatch repair protein PMS1 putativemismatch repair protein [Leptomonas pyrrhocoris]
MITRLDDASARKISAGQVITDLTSVVKELLENALDAHAQVIKIRLVNHGLDEITVEDDGTGIPMGPIIDVESGVLREGAGTPLLSSRASTKHFAARGESDGVALSSAPSSSSLLPLRSSGALKPEPDEGVGESARDPSLGFRGEALHSLANVSDLTVDTRTRETAPYTICITYDPTTHTSHVAVSRLRDEGGTTVTARRLFANLPVRHREYTKNCRRQLSKATSTVRQYAVSHPHIRLLMTHQESLTSAVTTLVSLTGSGDASRSVTEAYGGLCVSHMQRVNWGFSFGEMCGFVSKVDGGGRLSSDHQVFALDGRLVDLPRLSKAINDAFAQCLPNASQRLQVGFFLQVQTNASLQYDVNLTPDKRKVLLSQEDRLADEVYRCALQEFSLASQSIELNRDRRMEQTKAADLRATELTRLTRTPVSATSFTQFTFKRPRAEESSTAHADGTSSGDGVPCGATASATMCLPKLGHFLYGDAAGMADSELDAESPTPDLLAASSSSSSSGMASGEDERDVLHCSNDDSTLLNAEGPASTPVADMAMEAVEVTRLSDEGIRQRSGGACHHCSFPDLAELAKVDLLTERKEERDTEAPGTPCTSGLALRTGRVPRSARHTLGAQTDSDLTQYFSKNSFKEMQVVGQFNHGFIIAVLKNGDVFVVDQHASDEKANYERLMRNYVATPQPLVIPVPVAMDAHEVNLAVEHADMLQHHGFKVRLGSDDTKLLVCSLPVLPYDVVSAADVVELVQQLVLYGTITHPLRAVWHSMATKACRSSIMIGTALTMKTMRQVVRRLGELEQPWNCPHGRPTLRLLGNLADLHKEGGGVTPQ